jgi:hypothetical protein
MGLHAIAYEHATLVEDHPDYYDMSEREVDECYGSDHAQTFCLDIFHRSFRGLKLGRKLPFDKDDEFIGGHFYRLHGRELDIDGLGDFRNRLTVAMYEIPFASGRDPQTGDRISDPTCYLQNLGDYEDEPFYEFLNFSDQEGYIGPEAAADLAVDFATHASVIEPQLKAVSPVWAPLDETYRRWQAMFELAAGEGAVQYR